MGLQVRLWKTGSWEEGPRISGNHAAFAPDDTLAVGDDFGVVRLVNPSTGLEYARLEMADQTNLLPQCFTSDGAQLVLRGRQTFAAYVWDLRTVRAELKAMGLDWDQPDYPAARPAEPRTLEVKMESVLSPEAEARRLIGLAIQQRRSQPAQAIETLRLAVGLDPQNAAGCNSLAWLLVTGPDALRDPGEAVTLARQAVAIAPKQHFYHNTLGVALYRHGHFKEAITSLETSLQGSQGNADAFDLFFLAMCRHRLGATAAARDDYHRAVRWVEERGAKLSDAWRRELADFRAEAEMLLKPE
jgi:Tfp pilus assembly protein PilF